MEPDILRREISKTALGVLDREVTIINGVRRIDRLRIDLPESSDPIFHTISAVESELDGFPTGDLRQKYDQDYLQELDRRLAQYLPKIEPAVFDNCHKLVARYDDGWRYR